MAGRFRSQRKPWLPARIGDGLQARLLGFSWPRTRLLAEPEPRLSGSASRGAQLLAGSFNTAGQRVPGDGKSPWTLISDAEMNEALQGFQWLDDLLAAPAPAPAAEARAREWTEGWIALYGRGRGPGWTPALAGARLIRLICRGHALRPIGAPFTRSLGRHAVFLSRRWHAAPPGLPRIEALTALIFAGLTLEGMEHHVIPALTALGREAETAVGDDGTIPSRNPSELLDVLFHLILAATALAECGHDPAEGHLDAIARIAPVLRALRHGDSGLPRFHGGIRGMAGRLDQALASSGVSGRSDGIAMGYARLSGGRSTVIVDAAPPPQGPASVGGHASTLAFELTSGRRPVIVNCGSGRGFGGDWKRAARATPSHSTLGIDGVSSSRLGAMTKEGELLSDIPQTVTLDRKARTLMLSHDGWRATHGLLHVRQISLSDDGSVLSGEDALGAVTAADRAAFGRLLDLTGQQEVSYSIRFHLHPDVEATLDDSGDLVTLALRSGERWKFHHDGEGLLALQPSVYLDQASMTPRSTRQIVLSATVVDFESQIGWTLAKAQDRARHIRDLESDDVLADA